MGLAILGVLIGLNIASTLVLGWFARKLEQAFAEHETRNANQFVAVETAVVALEKRKWAAEPDPAQEPRKVRGLSSIRQLRNELEQESMEKR